MKKFDRRSLTNEAGAYPLLAGATDCAHARQIHARLTLASGTRAKSSAEKVTSWHQHGCAKLPVAAAMQPFARPHKGHLISNNGWSTVGVFIRGFKLRAGG